MLVGARSFGRIAAMRLTAARSPTCSSSETFRMTALGFSVSGLGGVAVWAVSSLARNVDEIHNNLDELHRGIIRAETGAYAKLDGLHLVWSSNDLTGGNHEKAILDSCP
jgi:hypothetical protein